MFLELVYVLYAAIGLLAAWLLVGMNELTLKIPVYKPGVTVGKRRLSIVLFLPALIVGFGLVIWASLLPSPSVPMYFIGIGCIGGYMMFMRKPWWITPALIAVFVVLLRWLQLH